jgi:hypothetical protein
MTNNPCPNDWIEVLKAVGPVGSWILVIVGWAIVKSDNNARQQRKEIRERLDSLIYLITDIEKDSFEYYLLDAQEAKSAGLAVSLKAKLRKLATDIHILCDINPSYHCSSKLIDFRQSISANDFETLSRLKLSRHHRRFSEISSAAVDLISSLEQVFTAA